MSAEVSEDWSISCISDGEDFTPSAEELETYYLALESGNIQELQWQCPGRRAPSPINNKEEPKVSETVEKEAPAKNDFDFMDDVALPQMRVRSQNSTPKSAKKKTANFAGVIESLKKQMLSQNKEGS
ncbi:uncharacterized protein LOC129911014 [Episyrphus balteatus]|uniref:uncharacterized protein LOC129911014 n=1 Tax=Episyrphus balteatus TaxID=286459 RepID=UPI002485A408|nr:uncharacterized protein LOC129911014 [Episyrphus balteatus]